MNVTAARPVTEACRSLKGGGWCSGSRLASVSRNSGPRRRPDCVRARHQSRQARARRRAAGRPITTAMGSPPASRSSPSTRGQEAGGGGRAPRRRLDRGHARPRPGAIRRRPISSTSTRTPPGPRSRRQSGASAAGRAPESTVRDRRGDVSKAGEDVCGDDWAWRQRDARLTPLHCRRARARPRGARRAPRDPRLCEGARTNSPAC